MTTPAKRGRPPGTGGPNAGSLMARLELLAVGEVAWVETTVEACASRMRQATTASRFPIGMTERRFATQAFTAVSNSRMGDVHLLLRIERTA